MEKIPVFKTLEDAYGFAFGKFFSLLGICWLPFLLIGIPFYFYFRQIFELFPTIMALDDPTLLLTVLPYLPLLILGSFFGMCVILVGMTQLALGQLRPPVFVYFSLGYPVWRLLFAVICVYLLLLGLVLCLVLVGALVGAGVAAGVSELLGVAIAVILSMVFAVFTLYFGIRLTFFIVPVTVAEGKNVIGRSWALSKGNVVRIIAVLAGVFLPIMVLQMITQGAAFGAMFSTMGPMPMPSENMSPEEGLAFFYAMMESMSVFFMVLIPVMILLSVLLYGAIAGAAAFAYRAVAAEGGEAPPT